MRQIVQNAINYFLLPFFSMIFMIIFEVFTYNVKNYATIYFFNIYVSTIYSIHNTFISYKNNGACK